VITGIHAIVFSPGAEKVRAFFADVLGLPSVDAGGGRVEAGSSSPCPLPSLLFIQPAVTAAMSFT
jgi:hypothetical protein